MEELNTKLHPIESTEKQYYKGVKKTNCLKTFNVYKKSPILQKT